MSAPGYNPLRWNCDSQGCFNKKKRPKIELFADCFPGLISFGDVDGLTEMSGCGLLLEWKPQPVRLATGQRLMYQRLTTTKILSVFIVAGDAETMSADYMAKFEEGIWYDWQPATLLDVQTECLKWARAHAHNGHYWTPTETYQNMVHKLNGGSK